MNNCDCNKPKHGGNLPPAVLQLVEKQAPVLFHKSTFPAAIGDETTNPPDTLDYKNVLLTYEATNKSYLYSSDGIPTLISMGEINADQIEKELKALGAQVVEMGNEISELQSGIANLEDSLGELQTDIANETLARVDADDSLRTLVNNETANREEAIAQLDQTVAGMVDSVEAAQTAAEAAQTSVTELTDTVNSLDQDVNNLTTEVKDLQDQTVQLDTTISTDESTVTLTKSQGTLLGEEPTETAMAMPVASETEAGIMNAATYKAVQNNAEDINSILQGAVAITGLVASPTQEQLNDAWLGATELGTLINRASIFDVDNNKLWYYYTNTSTWYSVSSNGGGEVTVSQFTNDTAGIIKGSESDGQIFAEADGTGSVVGWDGVKHDIDNLTQLVAGIDTPKLYDAYSTATDGANTANFLNTILSSKRVILGSGATGNGDSRLSQDYSIGLGNNAKTGWGTSNSNFGIAIGISADVASSSSSGTNGAIAIGGRATVTHSSPSFSSIAIGYFSKAGYEGVAIGRSADANTPSNSVALGAHSKTTRTGEVSIGSGDTSTAPTTRYLGNVRAGEKDTDAVNLKQLNDAIAAIGGDSQLTDAEVTKVQNLGVGSLTNLVGVAAYEDKVELDFERQNLAAGGATIQTATINAADDENAGLLIPADKAKLDALTVPGASRAANLPLQVFYNTGPTDYNGDNIEVHLIMKDLSTGGDATMPFTINGATATTAGVMTSTQAAQLAELVEGGSGGIELYDTYSTATDGANTAAFINSKFNNLNGVYLGYGVTAPVSGTSRVIIGTGASATDTSSSNGSVAIGSSAKATSTNGPGVVVGKSSTAGAYSAVLGMQASASDAHSVALGGGAKTSRSNEVSIGGSTSATYPTTRFLANVTDGVLDQDAVTVHQLNAAIGDIQSLLDNLNTGDGV